MKKKYPAYKPSGIEWIGDIPEHWKVKRLRYILKKNGLKIGPFGSALKYEFIRGSGYKIYGQEHVIKDDFSLGHKYLDEEKFQELSVYEIVQGDVVVTMMGTTGKSKVVPKSIERGIMDSHLIRLRTEESVYMPELLSLVINDSHLVYSQIKWLSKGSIMEGLNSTIIKSLSLPVPPLEEQKAILKYVSRTTDLINETIRKKQRLIDLLQEERTALINQAVTLGLNTDVKMKPSGVDWLGNVPDHWEVKRVTHISSLITGYAFKSENFSFQSGVRLVRGDNITEGILRWGDKTRYWKNLSDELERFFLQPSDIVIGMDGSKVGKNYAMVQQSDLPLLLVQRVARIRSTSLTIQEWIFLWISSQHFRNHVDTVRTDPAIPHITLKNIRDFIITIPPENEMLVILQYVKETQDKIASTIDQIQKEILLLQEYRIALINEVVTGKQCVIPTMEEVFA